MATTEAQLIDFVLDNFADTGAGQSANSDSVSKVQPYIAPVLAELAESQVIYAADGDSVPDAAVLWVAAIIARAPGLRDHFALKESAVSEEYCRARLRAIKAPETYVVTEAQYY